MKPGKSKERRDGDRPRKSFSSDNSASRTGRPATRRRADSDQDDLSTFFKKDASRNEADQGFSAGSEDRGNRRSGTRQSDEGGSIWSKKRNSGTESEDRRGSRSPKNNDGVARDDWSFDLDDKPRRSSGEDDSWGEEKKPRRSFSDNRENRDFRGRKEGFDRDERPARRSRDDDSAGNRERSGRSFSDKKEGGGYRRRQDDFGRDDRPSRRENDFGAEGDKPKRSFSDRREGSGFRRRQDNFEGGPGKRYEKDGERQGRFSQNRDDDRSYKPSSKRFSDGEAQEGREEGFRERRGADRRGKSFDGDRPFRKSYSRNEGYQKREGGSGFRERRESGRDRYERTGPRDKKSSKAPVKATVREDMRLNKYLSNSGICSRREADILISTGVVSVNGKVITEMGFRVSPGDVVVYGGQAIKPERNVYLLLNKPKDFITTNDDPQNRKTVMHLVEGACKERIYPVGRLDRNTTGLLLMTNDGNMADLLSHPSSKVRKIYHVTLDKNISARELNQLVNEGVNLDDGPATADEAEFVEEDSRKEVGITLHSGRNRIVRRMFEALGYNVIKLDRVSYAGLTKKDLPRGRWRMLSEKEVGFLKMNAK